MSGIALIVGVGSGNSAAFARALAADGYRVVLAARNVDKLEDLCREINAQAIQCDASSVESVAGLFRQLQDSSGPAELVLYNASAYTAGSITELDPELVHDSLMQTAYAAFLVAQQAVIGMQQLGHGSLFFTGATASVKGFPNFAPFAMGKFALRGLAQSLARELGPQNIHVAHFLIDGGIASPGRDLGDADNPLNRDDAALEPDAIAQTYMAVLKQHRSAWTHELDLPPLEGELLMLQPVDYLSPDVPGQLPWHDVPLIVATDESVADYGYLVADPDACKVEIVQWPAQGWRPIDAGTGDEGGVVEGVFNSEWRGEVLHAQNDAVGGNYILGWSDNPAQASDSAEIEMPPRVLLWHLNYHPDGGQMFFPLAGQPFVVPVALPGDDLALEQIVAFWCDGSQGLYIHPGIWHEGVFPATRKQSFRDRQGRVHARVSCNIAQEFGVFLNVPLAPDQADLAPGPVR